jgi:hypothetical protein
MTYIFVVLCLQEKPRYLKVGQVRFLNPVIIHSSLRNIEKATPLNNTRRQTRDATNDRCMRLAV